MRRSLGIILLLILVLVTGMVWAIFSATVNQPVTVTTPFTVTVTSSAGASCTGTTTITCSPVSFDVGTTELLNATIVYGSHTSVTYQATSANPSVATVTPAGPATITAPTNRQSFTVTGVSAGSTSITLSFN